MLCAAVILIFAAASGSARAAPCAGFTDVPDTSAFCGDLEWIKNRGITLGCASSTLYCPNQAVSRLEMAAFAHRLGTALTPVTLVVEATPGPLDVDMSPVLCATSAFDVSGFPRRAFIDASVSASAAGALDIGVSIVASSDGGATWTPLDNDARNAVLANRWGHVSNIAMVDLDVGQSIRFGIRLTRADSGPVDASDSRCSVRAIVQSRRGGTSPL
jgi:hypothetical protein